MKITYIIKSVLMAVFVSACACLHGGEAVKYRGIFVNDEDWGLRPWAVKHFGKQQQIGTSAYAMIFDLMRKNSLNLIWPAMHEGGYEFASRPENIDLASEYGIRVGTSHCEPMLRNNCYIPKPERYKWSWLEHKDFLLDYWKWSVDRYAKRDILWTIGMRGIHDGKMKEGANNEEKIKILEEVFAAQCGLLEAAGAGDAPRLFIPYKEVLPIFNAGLKVPAGTTIMWPNDNFGYIRRLGGPQCEGYPGGIYWHVSYHGYPHGYLHLCTTPPAFMWYELVAKCWQNGARDVWMVNAGDVFQAEILLYALGKFAADPEAWGPGAQGEVLEAWAKEFLGESDGAEALAKRIAEHLAEYYNLGFIRKPEHMSMYWTRALPEELKVSLRKRYESLLKEDEAIEAALGEELRDAYFRKVGFQARFLAHAGIIHLDGRNKEYARSVIDPLMVRWDGLDGGKWSGFWSDTIEEVGARQPSFYNRWSSQMQWPWNEPDPQKKDRGVARKDMAFTSYKGAAEPEWLEPCANTPANGGSWQRVIGLGTSARALALLPVKPGVGNGAKLEYDIPAGSKHIVIQFLPDFALWPGLKLGVNASFGDAESAYVAVPASNSNIGEHDRIRNAAVQDNFVRVTLDVPDGARKLTITATDPGVVIDRIGISK